jgi:Ca-activated chloride channel homolog
MCRSAGASSRDEESGVMDRSTCSALDSDRRLRTRAQWPLVAIATSCLLAIDAHTQDQPLFSVASDLVVLHVVVTGRDGQYVTGLTKDAFSVVEDGQPQTILFLTREDAPVTVGLVVDDSGSMQPNRDRVIAATAGFADASNPQDEMFVLTFNDQVRPVLPATAPFTNDASTLRSALSRALRTNGRTALFDALCAGLDYLKHGHYERQALVLVSDGRDNASRATFADVITRTEASNALIYTVAIVDPVESDQDPQLLKRIANASGAESFAPTVPRAIPQILQRIARDLRQVYTIGYVSTNSARDGRFRRLRVRVVSPDHRRVMIRTRAGYFAGTPRSGNYGARR